MDVCKYNDGVTCAPSCRRCENCGWSPDVDKRRREGAPLEKWTKGPTCGPNRSKRVAKVDATGQVVEVYSSISLAAAQNGVSRDVVRNRCEGRAFGHILELDYTFCYLKD